MMGGYKGLCLLTALWMVAAGGDVHGQCDAHWMYTYDCDVLPNVSGAIQKIGGGSTSFFLSNSDPAAVYLNGDGTLTINDLVTSGNHYCTVDATSGIWSVPCTVEVRMAVLQSTANNSVPLRVSNGSGNSWEWWIYTDRIFGARTVFMDMTQMRVMRIAFEPASATLYIDNDGTIEAIDGYLRTTSTTNQLLWGDTYSNDTAHMVWDYVYWLTGAAYDLDAQICTLNETDCGYWGYLPADLNEDCFVNQADLMIFIDQWLTCTDPSGAGCIQVN